MLEGKAITGADAFGGYVRLHAGNAALRLHDGVNVRLYAAGEKRPDKHQLLVELDDGAALQCSVQMYGGLWVHVDDSDDNFYYRVALEKPSPLSDAFDRAYFETILAEAKLALSAKALLATEQRIPGLGNGVLQDILLLAGVHPKRKVGQMDDATRDKLFAQVKATLADMTTQGGRNTEKDLYGNPGGYQTLLCAKTAKAPCPICGAAVVKQAYMGGSVYFCPTCQPL